MKCKKCDTELINTSRIPVRKQGQFIGHAYGYVCPKCETLQRIIKEE